jgi:hypothetical protein
MAAHPRSSGSDLIGRVDLSARQFCLPTPCRPRDCLPGWLVFSAFCASSQFQFSSLNCLFLDTAAAILTLSLATFTSSVIFNSRRSFLHTSANITKMGKSLLSLLTASAVLLTGASAALDPIVIKVCAHRNTRAGNKPSHHV